MMDSMIVSDLDSIDSNTPPDWFTTSILTLIVIPTVSNW